MKKNILLIILNCMITCIFVHAEDYGIQEINKTKLQIQIEENATKEYIDGEYIPKNLYEAMDILDSLIEQKDKEKINSLPFYDRKGYLYKIEAMDVLFKWKLLYNSSIASYLIKYGSISHAHLDARPLYDIITDAFLCYINDSTFYLPTKYNLEFVLDSNLMIFIDNPGRPDTSQVSSYAKIVKKDSTGNLQLYEVFERKEYLNHLRYSSDSSFTNFQSTLFDKKSLDFVKYLPNSFKKFNSSFKYIEIDFDSILFIRDYSINEVSGALYKLKEFLLKSDTNSLMMIEKYNVYYNIGKAELDSLDNVMYEKMKIMGNKYDDSEQYNIVDAILKDFLSNKEITDLYIFRFIPYIKFDFKDYKLRTKKYKY